MPNLDIIEATTLYRHQIPARHEWSNLIFLTASLPFVMQAQTQTNWCWSATSVSTSLYYSSTSLWTQCSLAGAELGLSTCCNTPVPSACNVPWYLDRALTKTGNLERMVNDKITFHAIQDQIKAGKPVGARQQWSGGGGHFMVIFGCSRIGNTDYLDIADPASGNSTVAYDTFVQGYQGNGTWTHTYLTKKESNLMFDLQPIPEAVFKWVDETARLRHLRKGLDMSAYDPDLAVSVPHSVFVSDLDNIAKSNIAESAVGLRVFQSSGQSIEAVYDFDVSDAAHPKLQSTADNSQFNAVLTKALEIASTAQSRKDKSRGSDALPQLRYLKIPALYVEGFWVHEAKGRDDLFVPTRGGMLIDELEPIALSDAIKLLQVEAKRRLSVKQDDDMAP